MAYTKSVRFFAGEDIPENMVIRFSIWDDTAPEEIKIAMDMGLPVYTAVDKFDDSITEDMRCHCENCSECNKCWSRDKRNAYIVCEIH